MVEGDWFSMGTLPLSIPLRLSEKNLPPKWFRCCYPPPLSHSPDFAQVDLFIFRKVKDELAGLHQSQKGPNNTWREVMQTVGEEEVTTSFRVVQLAMWKVYRICSDYVEKSGKMNNLLTKTTVVIFSYSSLFWFLLYKWQCENCNKVKLQELEM